MEKDRVGPDAQELTPSESSDTYVESDSELSTFLHNSQKIPLRHWLVHGCTKSSRKSLSLFLTLIRLISQAGLVLLPSYVSRRIVGGPSQPNKLYATSALDGLRGFACYFVFNFHLLFTYSEFCQYGYGVGEEGENRWFHQLPFIRLIYAGPSMVAIFFVISGYVLSHKALKLIRKRSWDQVLYTISSSVFRRAIRLFLPTIFATFITMLCIREGMFKYSTEIAEDNQTLQGHNEEHPVYFETAREQFWDWYESMLMTTNPWDWSPYFNHYDPHLWTIPFEFRSSIVLFLTLVGVAKLRSTFRFALECWLIWYCIYCDRWEVTLFLSGMFLADMDLAVGIFDTPSPLTEKLETPVTTASNALHLPVRLITSLLCRLRRIFWILVFVLGLYFASCPNVAEDETPGFRYLITLVPERYTQKYRFWQSVGGVLIVASVNHSRDIQPLFTNRLAQYLGNISYAFYIVHGPILHSLGYVVMKTAWSRTGKESLSWYVAGFVAGWAVVMPTVFWTADVFWRAVDIPCVKFARWVEKKVEVK